MRGFDFYNRSILIGFALSFAAVCQAVERPTFEEEAPTTGSQGISELSITNTLPVTADVREQGGKGFVNSRYVYLNIGGDRLAFRVPDNYMVSVSDPKRIAIYSADYRINMTVEFQGQGGTFSTSEGLKESLLESLNGALAQGDDTFKFGPFSGIAVDMLHKEQGLTMSSKFGVVNTRAGVFRLHYSASPEKSGANSWVFYSVAGSIRFADSSGKIELLQVSDRS